MNKYQQGYKEINEPSLWIIAIIIACFLWTGF